MWHATPSAAESDPARVATLVAGQGAALVGFEVDQWTLVRNQRQRW